MYDPVNKVNGVSAVEKFFAAADGLQLESPNPKDPTLYGKVVFPQFLLEWLKDLRLLRRIPLCYLVPDARLLPPESIRFFHVDHKWLDRLIDGVYSAADLGTVDATFTYASLLGVRQSLDQALSDLAQPTNWNPATQPMTGMLIRSELVRRWPDMLVTAFSAAQVDKDKRATQPLTVLRAETISTDIYIALFAGQPQRVCIREPHVGTRFGVKPTNKVDQRDQTGKKSPNDKTPNSLTVPFRQGTDSALDVTKLNSQIPAPNGSRMIALQLEQPAYLQDFLPNVNESQGSQSPMLMIQANNGSPVFKLNGGKTMNLDIFVARLAEAEEQRKR